MRAFAIAPHQKPLICRTNGAFQRGSSIFWCLRAPLKPNRLIHSTSARNASSICAVIRQPQSDTAPFSGMRCSPLSKKSHALAAKRCGSGIRTHLDRTLPVVAKKRVAIQNSGASVTSVWYWEGTRASQPSLPRRSTRARARPSSSLVVNFHHHVPADGGACSDRGFERVLRGVLATRGVKAGFGCVKCGTLSIRFAVMPVVQSNRRRLVCH